MADGNAIIGWAQRPRVELVLQAEAAECALACLAMVTQYHGNPCGLAYLRRRYSSTLKGTTLNQIIQIADDMGLDCRPLRSELEYLSETTFPAILHWDMSHFVVLAAVRGNKFVIMDPALGQLLLTQAELSTHFTGVMLELQPSILFKKLQKPPSVPLSAMTGRISGLKRSLLQVLALALAIEALGLCIPLQAQWTVDQISESTRSAILTVAGIFAVIVIIQAALNIARAWLISWAGANIGSQWTTNVFGHLMRLPLEFFEKRRLADIMSRFSSIRWIQMTLTGSFVTVLLDGLTGSLALVMLLVYSRIMAVAAIMVALTYGVSRVFLFKALWRASEENLIFDARQQTELMESVRGIQAIKLANCQAERRARIANATVEASKRVLTTDRIRLGFSAASQGIFGLQRVLLLSFGAYLMSKSAVSAGMVIAALSYADQFSNRIGSFIDKVVELRMLSLHLERLSDITTAEADETGSKPIITVETAPGIEVSGLSYRYSEWDPWIIKDLNITIEPGQCVALIGQSGCGKTTLAKIILGLITQQEGEVNIGGFSRNKVGSKALSGVMAAVMQDDCLFSGSIAENVAFFDPSAKPSDIFIATRAAGIHNEISSMPMGYETLVGDMGSTLSGGQKQRLLLARALYRKPKVLVLDEATSHLDTDNEKITNESVQALDITRIVIAHRKETIAMADRVFDLSTKKWIR